MSDVTILTPGTRVRILRPLPTEPPEAFRRRMEAMVVVLAEHSPDTVAVFLAQPSGRPVCVVTQVCAPADS